MGKKLRFVNDTCSNLWIIQLHPPKFNIDPEKWWSEVVRRLLSYLEGNFSEAILNFGRLSRGWAADCQRPKVGQELNTPNSGLMEFIVFCRDSWGL